MTVQPVLERHDPEWDFADRLRKALREGGVEGTPHALRHYFATAVLAASDIYTAQKALRHASIATTQIYAQLPDQRLRDAISRIGDVA